MNPDPKDDDLKIDMAVTKVDIQYIKGKLDEISHSINSFNDKFDKMNERITNLEKYREALNASNDRSKEIMESEYKKARLWFLGFTTAFTALNFIMMVILRVR